MLKKYLKIFGLLFKNNISVLSIIKSIVEYSVYFIFLNILFNNIRYFSNYSNIQLYLISGGYLLIILFYKYFYENALIFRYLIITDNFGGILLKPINSLYRLLVSEINPSGLVITILISGVLVYFGSLQYLFLIFSGLVISLSIFIFVLSLTLVTSGKMPIEKILVSLFLIGFLGLVSFIGSFLSLIVSIALLFLSIQFWNYALTRYTSASI